ncbi:MAG: deubiquitinating enzyme [Trizodia sp. TS-e1964]|nr:MAG: deubiquitinating enzyme [Trizodia sp. TS-e1964]
MATIPVVVKHQGKRHNVELDPESTGETFKYQLYSITGVEPDRQKILVKGGQLKDETELSTLGIKPGHNFIMMGTPSDVSNVLERPKEKMRFLEDMTSAEIAKADGAIPAGLQNLGNTCYMNSTLQVLRSVPEMQQELVKYKPPVSDSSSSLGAVHGFGSESIAPVMDLTAALRDLYHQMAETQEGFPPFVFLSSLRKFFPQFAQMSKDRRGYAQQDAEEAWSQIISVLKARLIIKDTTPGSASETSFVDKYLGLTSQFTLECDEPAAKEAGEVIVMGEEEYLKLNCHISSSTNHLADGILAALDEKIEKHSSVLGREAVFTKKSRLSRLPKYLTVHFVRFFWKREAQKKAKIMRKVTFPRELDVIEFCTDELKKKLVPVRDKIRDVRKDEEDIIRARKRQKMIEKNEQEAEKASKESKGANKIPSNKSESKEGKDHSATKGDIEMPDVVYKTDAEVEQEKAAAVLAAKKELLALVDPSLAADEGANKSGLYELRGVVTHQGSSADSGHYTSYVKKEGPKDPKTGKPGIEDGKWWWFNDEKVSEVDADKIDALSGGGESHSALILLYRAVPVPTKEDVGE